MTTPPFSSQQEREIKRLLEFSSTLYDTMTEVYSEFEKRQLTDSEHVTPLLHQLEELKRKIQELDAKIISKLQDLSKPSTSLAAAIQLRKEKIRTLIVQNTAMVETVQRHKAIIQSELSTLSKNKNAISGYGGQATQEKKSFISGAY